MRPRLDALEGYLVDHGADWASRAGDVVSRPFTRLEGYCNRRYWARLRRNAPPPSPPVGPFARAMHDEIAGCRDDERRDINRQIVRTAPRAPRWHGASTMTRTLNEPRWWIPPPDEPETL